MDISYYIKLFRRWLWVILVVGIIGVVLGYIFATLGQPTYVAKTLLSVGGYIQSPNPESAEVDAGVNLAQTYMVMATTRDVLQTAVDATDFPLTVEELRRDQVVNARVVPDTSILELSVTYSNPTLAASLSNQIAQQLILISPTDPRLSQSGRREVPSNYLQVVEWATIPDKPSNPGSLQLSVIAGFLGAVLASGVVLVSDYLDQSIRVAEEVDEARIGSVLVTIPRHKWPSNADHHHLIKFDYPTPIADRFRALRTILLHDSEGQEHLLYIITSPSPDEGKSFVISNLAIAFAVAKKRVLLIDTDLHRPTLHTLFGRENQQGLTDLLNTEPPDNTNNRLSKAYTELTKFCQGTDYEGLSILTSGLSSANPTELLGSEKAAEWFDILQSLPDFDVLLIDSPPSLVAVDAFVVAGATGGPILMVMRSGKTEEQAAQELRTGLERLNLKLRGVVMNDVPTQELGGYYKKSLDYYRVSPPRKKFQGIKLKNPGQELPE